MTPIKIEKKEPIWPWISLVFNMLGIILYLADSKSDSDSRLIDFDDDFTSIQMEDSQTWHSSLDEIQVSGITIGVVYDSFKAFNESISDSTRIAVNSYYAKVVFLNLTKLAVSHANSNDVEGFKVLGDLRNFSVLITSIAKTSNNNQNFKTVCDKIVSVLGDMQAKSYPVLKQDVESLKQLASNVNVSSPMDHQQAVLNGFFVKSRGILKVMSQD